MKKIISLILVIVISVGLTSCYQDLERNSLEEYIAYINKNNFGFSNVEIDKPAEFLPSISFLDEYEYLEGTYFWREDGSWAPKNILPDIALLTLKYDESIYEDAKQVMLEEIKPYENKFYQYNAYNFYINSNHHKIANNGKSRFPKYFTMACYNDENCTLIFMGFYAQTVNEKYLEDIEGNWEAFVDQYYGEYYDFSQ